MHSMSSLPLGSWPSIRYRLRSQVVFNLLLLLVKETQEITLDAADSKQFGLIRSNTHQSDPNLCSSFNALEKDRVE
jgi:hypothetical protein